jgi:hypothetical protein
MLAITTRLIITDYNGNVSEYTNVEARDSCHSFVPVPSQNLSFHWKNQINDAEGVLCK